MIEKIHHIGLAVQSIPDVLQVFGDTLGLIPEHTELLPERGVKVAFLRVGESYLELLEPTSETSTIAKFLRVRGEGIHHICLEVPDIAAALAELKQRGIKLIDEQPRMGARGARVAFLHPSSTHGILLELHEEEKCPSNEA